MQRLPWVLVPSAERHAAIHIRPSPLQLLESVCTSAFLGQSAVPRIHSPGSGFPPKLGRLVFSGGPVGWLVRRGRPFSRLRCRGAWGWSVLLKYLGDIYKSTPKPPSGEASATSTSAFIHPYFQPQSGISVPSDFTEEFDRVAALSQPKPAPAPFLSAFRVANDVAPKYFDLEFHSPEILALGDTCSAGNRFKSRSFRTDEGRWKFVSSAARHSLRLSTYATSLSRISCVMLMSLASHRRIVKPSPSSSHLFWNNFFPNRRAPPYRLLDSAADLRFQLLVSRNTPITFPFIRFPFKVRTFLLVSSWKRLMRNLICTRGPPK